jgi:predicted N-acetyltransferase YhbS
MAKRENEKLSFEYRILSREEIQKLAEIDRTETIENVYCVRNGELSLEKEHWDVGDWDAQEKQKRIARLQKRYDDGDTLFGAFHGPTLVGLSIFEPEPLPSAAGRFNLAGLWVSQKYRGKGIGRTLAQMVIDKARESGAKTVYVSATPSENTVRFYMSVGFRLAASVDPDMFEHEPKDVHLELIL